MIVWHLDASAYVHRYIDFLHGVLSPIFNFFTYHSVSNISSQIPEGPAEHSSSLIKSCNSRGVNRNTESAAFATFELGGLYQTRGGTIFGQKIYTEQLSKQSTDGDASPECVKREQVKDETTISSDPWEILAVWCKDTLQKSSGVGWVTSALARFDGSKFRIQWTLISITSTLSESFYPVSTTVFAAMIIRKSCWTTCRPSSYVMLANSHVSEATYLGGIGTKFLVYSSISSRSFLRSASAGLTNLVFLSNFHPKYMIGKMKIII